jgi:Pyruvate/2-oxoacid:ferredoxin oxidoreductase delta subunit
MSAVAAELGLSVADFENGNLVSSPKSIRNKQFTIAKGVLQADGMFGLPKLKTHHLTRITAAMKNQFGCIPGILKPALHVALPDVDEFSKMLVDLNICLGTRLFILDAIEAMDGNGPTSGNTYRLGALAFSTDPVALDATVCRMINLEPSLVRTNYWGEAFGLGKMNSAEIEIVGDDLRTFSAPGFNVQRQPEPRFNQAWRYRRLKGLITNRPVIDAEKCKRCGECVDQCPQTPKALYWDRKAGGPPKFDYRQCIRCFCCQEVCPFKAIDVQVPLARRIVDFGYSVLYGN